MKFKKLLDIVLGKDKYKGNLLPIIKRNLKKIPKEKLAVEVQTVKVIVPKSKLNKTITGKSKKS